MQADLSEQLTELIPRLRRFARGLAGNIEMGDELVQAACERLLGNRDRLRPGTRLDSWMYRVIRNLHIDGIRADAVRKRSALQIRAVEELRATETEGMEDHVRLHEVEMAMRQLPEEQRSVLMLVCVEGFSYKEAAAVLQIPMGTVTSRLTRGRQALIALIDQGKGTRPDLEISE